MLREEGPASALNGDGFGVGWYSKEHSCPCIFTSTSPAWNNSNLHRLSCQISSSLFYAHIRAASPGSPTNESNCHPFQFEQFMWMHNGMIADFRLIKKKIINHVSDDLFNLIQGTTDSEYSFILFLHCLFTRKNIKFVNPENRLLTPNTVQINDCTAEDLKVAMLETIKKIKTWILESKTTNSSMMNFCITDGKNVVCSRYASFPHGNAASLFYSSGSRFQRNPKQPNTFMMLQADRRQRCHILTSEPLTIDNDDWVEVSDN